MFKAPKINNHLKSCLNPGNVEGIHDPLQVAGDVDRSRSYNKDIRRNLLQSSVQRETGSADNIDDALGQGEIQSLHIHDHRFFR